MMSLSLDSRLDSRSLSKRELSSLSASIPGDLFYGTCNLPDCSTLEFAAWNLTTDSSVDLFDFPLHSFEDTYVADDLLIQPGDGTTEVVISLQFDNATQDGYLVTFDIDKRVVVGGVRADFCFAIWLDPFQKSSTDSILCLALGPGAPCGGSTQCTSLVRISRTTGASTTIASFLPDYCPFTVQALDPNAAIIYATFESCNGGLPALVQIDARSGAILKSVSFPITLAFIEFEWRASTRKIYAVVQDSSNRAAPVAYLGIVDPATATAAPLSPAAYFNVSFPPSTGGFINQFNTISTISEDAHALFFTAFHYAVPSPPNDPILHLIGNDLISGAIVYDSIVTNPFCEILWIPDAST
jgi:hypothetical protein